MRDFSLFAFYLPSGFFAAGAMILGRLSRNMSCAATGRCAVMQKLVKSRSLLALCAVCHALFAVIILLISPDGPLVPRTFRDSTSVMELMGVLALTAGACTIAAGIWNARKARTWLLVMNGLACCELGMMVLLGPTRPVAFRTIALLIVLMAVSIGSYELVTARTFRAHPVDEWLLAGAGVVSVGFAAVFLGFVLRWIRLEPSPSGQTFYWLGAYFVFSAVSMLGLALGHLRPQGSIHPLGTGALPTA